MQGPQLRYAIKFVADMDKTVKFYRGVSPSPMSGLFTGT